jgi:hypothetical protein
MGGNADVSLAGKWTYRSYRNDPSLVGDDANKALGLIFAEAVFTFDISDAALKRDDRLDGRRPRFGGGPCKRRGTPACSSSRS